MDLDELLTAAAPPIAPRTTTLRREVAALVAASEPRRRPVRLAAVGAVTAGSVLGLGAVASAAGILPPWVPWTTASGQQCQVQVAAGPRTPGDGEPGGPVVSAAEEREAVAAARAFLADFDYATVDRQRAIADWRAVEDRVRAEQPDLAERAPRLEGDDLEVTAVTRTVVERMRADLAARGLDLRVVDVIVSTTGCDL